MSAISTRLYGFPGFFAYVLIYEKDVLAKVEFVVTRSTHKEANLGVVGLKRFDCPRFFEVLLQNMALQFER